MSEQNFDKERFEEGCEKAYDEKHAEFEPISQQKLIISFLGSCKCWEIKNNKY